MKLTATTLRGGTRLLVRAPFESELVTLAVAVRVGFAHESREHLGISHMVEHLCFSDNRTRTFPALRRAVEELGGTFNGQTGTTATFYMLDVLADHWREGLALLRDIVTQPRFSPEACAREVKVLQAEVSQFRQRWLAWFYERGWFRDAWVLLWDRLWTGHMHSARTVHRYDRLNSDLLSAWHRRHYRRDNMAVVAVGRMDPDEVARRVEELFADLPEDPGEPLQHPHPTVSATDTVIETRLGTPFWNESVVAVGAWNGGTRSGEAAACDVLREHLRNRAFDRLRLDHCLAYRTGCRFDGRLHGGSLLLHASVKRGNEDQAAELLKGVLTDALSVDMPDPELSALRNKLLARYAHMNANPGWYAHGMLQSAFGEYELDADDYPAQLRALTPSRVREVLGRMATERGRLVLRQVPLLSVPATVCVAAGFLAMLTVLAVWAVSR